MPSNASLDKADMRLLRVFSTVVECGGFTPAQVVLNVSQSTISSHMSALEARLEMRLCERGRGGFRITEDGQRIYEAAQRLFQAVEAFGSNVEELRGRLTGELHIGAVDNVVTNPDFALSEAIANFERRHGEVHIRLHIQTPAQVESAVVDGRYQIGVGAYTKQISGIEYTPLLLERQTLYCGSTHPLFQAPDNEIEVWDLAQYKYIKRPYVPDDHLPAAEVLKPGAFAENMESIAILILSGSFIGFLPEHFAERWVDSGDMKPVLPERMHFLSQMELILRTTQPQTLAAKYFKDDIIEAFAAAKPDLRRSGS